MTATPACWITLIIIQLLFSSACNSEQTTSKNYQGDPSIRTADPLVSTYAREHRTPSEEVKRMASSEELLSDAHLKLAYEFLKYLIEQVDLRVERDVAIFGHRDTAIWFSDEILPQVQKMKDTLAQEHHANEDLFLCNMLEAQLDALEESVRAFSAAFANKSDDGYEKSRLAFQRVKASQTKLDQEWEAFQKKYRVSKGGS